MNINLNIELNKKEESQYTNDLDQAFMAYKLMRIVDPSLPDLECVSCDLGESIRYFFDMKNLTIEELQNMMSKYQKEV